MADKDAKNRRESQRILARIAQESDPSGSLAARAARRVQDHVSAVDADQGDKVELWGTRIGRVLGLVLLVVLVYWFYSFFAGG